MIFHLTTLGGQPWNAVCLDEWLQLVRDDQVGRHQTTNDPAEADRVVVVDLHQHPGDPLLRGLQQHQVVRRYSRKVVVFDQRDRPVLTFPGVYVGASGRLPERVRGRGVAGGPYPHLHTPVTYVEREPDLLWSFGGSRTHPVRERIFLLPRASAEVRDVSHVPLFGATVDPSVQSEYVELVRRSRYVLCPRGHGPSSYRLFETMAAGRVPVVISDDWLPPPRLDWSSFVLRLAERDVDRLPDLLGAETEDSWRRRSALARQAYDEHFAPGRVWHHVAETLSRLPLTRRRQLWTQPQGLRVATGVVRAKARRPLRRQ